MNPIRSLDEMVRRVKDSGRKKRIAVACAQDPNTIGAVAQSVNSGFAGAVMIGDTQKIRQVAQQQGIDPGNFELMHEPSEVAAVQEAVRMVKHNEADVLMKGLVGTDKFLKAVLDKERGLLPPQSVMSYVAAMEMPGYNKLLFVSDTAVIPFPDFRQKVAMVNYTVHMAHQFGIETPKVALISATEKVSQGFEQTIHDAAISKMAQRGQIKNAIVDGPLDVFLATDPESVTIKGISTPINGEADALIFPSLEACNSFYKGLMRFGGGQLAGLIQGTEKPVVVMSRSESAQSKFYCMALSCLMAAG